MLASKPVITCSDSAAAGIRPTAERLGLAATAAAWPPMDDVWQSRLSKRGADRPVAYDALGITCRRSWKAADMS
jgi:hypothetical protein